MLRKERGGQDEEICQSLHHFYRLPIFFICGLLFVGFAYLFSDTCDNVIPTPVLNARGDVAEERLQVCTGIGTVLNYSITLQVHGRTTVWTLVKFDEPSRGYPIIHWIDDDALSINLGKVRSVWGKVNRVGSIRITYSHTYTDAE